MAKRIRLTDARARLSTIVDQVLHDHERYVVERRGQAVAAIVSMEELGRIEAIQTGKRRPVGALALLGACGDVDDAEIDAIVQEIYTARSRDMGRPVLLET